MIVGFLGKGGSGKSTVATLMVRYLEQLGKTVLAVDADHNMDLAYNLGYDGNGPYIGGTFLPLRNQFGLNNVEPTESIFTSSVPSHRFSFTRPDEYSQQYVTQLSDRLHLMMSGPQNDFVLYGAHCSHSLAAPLKIYLPLLELAPDEVVVVDEKASVDAVTTGIPTGFDLAVVVAEPRIHSLRAAKQIAETLNWYEVPHLVVLNKQQTPDDIALFHSIFATNPTIVLAAQPDPLRGSSTAQVEALSKIAAEGAQQTAKGSNRLARTIRKYQRNESFQKVVG